MPASCAERSAPTSAKADDIRHTSVFRDGEVGANLQHVERAATLPLGDRAAMMDRGPQLTVERPLQAPVQPEAAWGQVCPFLIFTPEYVPDVVHTTVHFPDTVPAVLGRVTAARPEDHQLWFDRLFPVEPQPAREYAVLLGVPDWAHEQNIVFFDCTLINRTAYAIVVPDVVGVQDLRTLAGLETQPEVQVYVHDLERPVIDTARCFMRTGLLVAFARGRPPDQRKYFILRRCCSPRLGGPQASGCQVCKAFPSLFFSTAVVSSLRSKTTEECMCALIWLHYCV